MEPTRKHSRKLTFNQSISSAPTNDQGSKRVVITMDSPMQVLLEGDSTSDASSNSGATIDADCASKKSMF